MTQDEICAYTAGFRYAKEGPGVNNDSWAFFSTPALADAWERGKRCGMTGRKPMAVEPVADKRTANELTSE